MYKDSSVSALKAIVVEDNPSDFELIEIVCKTLAFKVDLIHFENGTDFFSYLKDKPGNHFSFFLIDLKNPVMGGKKILKRLRDSPTLSLIPSIIFSDSGTESDIEECGKLGANAYVLKPTTLYEFEKTIESIFNFWGTFNVLKCSLHKI